MKKKGYHKPKCTYEMATIKTRVPKNNILWNYRSQHIIEYLDLNIRLILNFHTLPPTNIGTT